MGSVALVWEIVVAVGGVIVGAGSSVGVWFRDPAWSGGDDTLGGVAGFGDGISTSAGTGTGTGTGGSWSDVPLALGSLGVEGRGTWLSL